MTLYEKYGWTPSTVAAIPEWEAARLAVYFEEEAKHARAKLKEAEARQRAIDDGNGSSRTVMELYDGEDESYAFEDNDS